MKRMFLKVYMIDTKGFSKNETAFNMSELYGIENEAFYIKSLGFCNTVVSTFSKNEEGQIILKVQLPLKSFLCNLVPLLFFLGILLLLFFSNELQTNKYSILLILVSPVIILFMGFYYQKEFLKKSDEYAEKIIRQINFK